MSVLANHSKIGEVKEGITIAWIRKSKNMS